MQLYVAVDHEHLLKGVPTMCANCPVALAIEDALDANGIRHDDVRVRMNTIYVRGFEPVRTEPYVRERIQAIDRLQSVEPFGFCLYLYPMEAGSD